MAVANAGEAEDACDGFAGQSGSARANVIVCIGDDSCRLP